MIYDDLSREDDDEFGSPKLSQSNSIYSPDVWFSISKYKQYKNWKLIIIKKKSPTWTDSCYKQKTLKSSNYLFD